MENSNEKSKECCKNCRNAGYSHPLLNCPCHKPSVEVSKCDNTTCNMLDGHKHISQIKLNKWEEKIIIEGRSHCNNCEDSYIIDGKYPFTYLILNKQELKSLHTKIGKILNIPDWQKEMLEDKKKFI
jgi:hypothetical protein